MLMLQLGGHGDETIVRGKWLFKILVLSISTGTRKLHICSWLCTHLLTVKSPVCLVKEELSNESITGKFVAV